MLSVLYVWNTAGALTAASDWLIKNGHKSTIIMHEGYDTYGMTANSISHRLPTTLRDLYLTVREEVKNLEPTHIHINSNVRLVPIARAAAPSTPIVFQYHGTDIRSRGKVHWEVRFLADKVIVSTPDLSKYGEVYGCPMPERFHDRGGRQAGTALLIISGSALEDKSEIARDYCKENGLDLTIVDCRAGERIESEKMPEYLSTFEYFFDFKGINALSKKAMEAIDCGCKVIPEDMSGILTDYDRTTPEDYVNLYNSMTSPSRIRTGLRLAVAKPWSRRLVSRARG